MKIDHHGETTHSPLLLFDKTENSDASPAVEGSPLLVRMNTKAANGIAERLGTLEYYNRPIYPEI